MLQYSGNSDNGREVVMKTVSIVKIARKANVSHSTVSRVLNNRPGISSATRSRILKLAETMHYTGSKHNRIVSVIIWLNKDEFSPYIYLLTYYLSIALEEAGFKQEIIYEHDLSLLSERFVCGAISLYPFNHFAKTWTRTRNLPLVCINDYEDMLGEVHSVCSDDAGGICKAMEYLYALGHRKIMLVCKNLDTRNSRTRVDAFWTMAEHYGIQQEVRIFNGDKDSLSNRFAGDSTAVLCCTETLSERIRQIWRRKIIGGECAFQYIAWTFPDERIFKEEGISTLTQDFRRLAEQAVHMLQSRIENQVPVHNILVPYLLCKHSNDQTG